MQAYATALLSPAPTTADTGKPWQTLWKISVRWR